MRTAMDDLKAIQEQRHRAQEAELRERLERELRDTCAYYPAVVREVIAAILPVVAGREATAREKALREGHHGVQDARFREGYETALREAAEVASELFAIEPAHLSGNPIRLPEDAYWLYEGDVAEAILALSAIPAAEPPSGCSCHPDDNPPRPCPRKHAYSECVAAAETAEPTAWVYELAHGRMENGEYVGWMPGISFTKPCVPEGSIRNLRPLFAIPAARRRGE